MVNRFWERFFPVKHDFYQMLSDQAAATAFSIQILNKWLVSKLPSDYEELFRQINAIDQLRLEMEAKLIEVFVTPFDRQDIYSLSVEMNKIALYAKLTPEEMQSFGTTADETIISMTENLHSGTEILAEAIHYLKMKPIKAEELIKNIREHEHAIEKGYRSGMTVLLENDDLRLSIKYREIYHHIKDTGNCLGRATDVLHRIVVRMI
jgi:uncharacterized protein Yka (UPF0111/DUF47 family)